MSFIMNNWIIIFICWIVFSVVILIGDKIGEIYIKHDWVLILLTMPVSIPVLIVALPIAFIIKIFNKIKFKKTKIFLDKNKKM